MEGLPLFDLMIFAVFILFAIRGYHRGMIKQTVGIIAFIVALLVGSKYYQEIAYLIIGNTFISRIIPMELANLLGFGLLVLLTILFINLLGYLLHLLSKVFFLSLLDNIGGALVGLLKGAFIIFIFLLIITELPFPFLNRQLNSSFFAKDLLSLVPLVKENFFSIFQP